MTASLQACNFGHTQIRATMTSPAYSVLPSGNHRLTKQTNYCLRRLSLQQLPLLTDVFQRLALFSSCADHTFEAVLAEGFHSFPQFLRAMAQKLPSYQVSYYSCGCFVYVTSVSICVPCLTYCLCFIPFDSTRY